MFLLPFHIASLLFEVLMRLSNFVIDDSESQVDHEEGADEDHEYEVQAGACVSRIHGQSHHIGPALEGHTLEDCQERH